MEEMIARIVALYEKKGWSAREFGIQIGLSRSPVNDWKAEKSSPTVPQIKLICEIFGVSSDFILFGKESLSPNMAVGVSGSAFYQGINHGTVTVKNGGERPLSTDELDLLRVYNELELQERARLLMFVAELDAKKKAEHNGSTGGQGV